MDRQQARLVGNLYEGALEPSAWRAALDGLCTMTESGVFHHVAWDCRAQCVVSGLANDAPPPEKVHEYELHHAANDPRIPLVLELPVGGILLDHEHFSARDMSRHPIYADWLGPLGYRHTLGIPVYDDGALREWVCLIRERDHQPYGDATQMWLRQLMPDLLRAARLRTRMAHTAAQAAMGMAALDALPQALAVVNAAGRVQHLNAAARRSLSAARGLCTDPGLCVRQGRIEATFPDKQAVLQAGIARAAGQGVPAAQGMTLRLHGHSEGTANPERISQVHVLPLAVTHALVQTGVAQPQALLLWTAAADTALHVEQLSTLLGLSESEARLALMLARGRSLKDFAAVQGCTWHTARTHNKNLLRKTGLHRQADLTRLVQSLLMPWW
ncbi:MAG: LuxR family transcriptional regulator [Burkholderiaceae bacterium]|nr:LuxR family transcriptional regulator [Burkholderiaceae bacterium]